MGNSPLCHHQNSLTKPWTNQYFQDCIEPHHYKNLVRTCSLDSRTNGALLSKLTECNLYLYLRRTEN